MRSCVQSNGARGYRRLIIINAIYFNGTRFVFNAIIFMLYVTAKKKLKIKFHRTTFVVHIIREFLRFNNYSRDLTLQERLRYEHCSL